MLSKPLALAAIAVGCIAAAGVGGFIATKTFNSPSVSSVSAPAPIEAAKAEPAVLESEAVVAPPLDVPSAADTTPAPAAAPRGAEAPVRTADRPRATSPKPAAKPSVPVRSDRQAAARRTEPEPMPAPAVEARSPSREVEPARNEPVREESVFAPMPTGPESRPVPVEPEKTFEELLVAADSVIGLQIENTLNSERARVEDDVEARVLRDVRVGGAVAIPAGSRMHGSVTVVEKGGKVRERARLGVRFHTLVLSDGSRVPIKTETIYREGESPKGESTAKIGGAAVGGAILGAILGGAKGAAIGGSVGAAGGTAAVMAGGRNAAELKAGSNVTVRLSDPVAITVERDRDQQ